MHEREKNVIKSLENGEPLVHMQRYNVCSGIFSLVSGKNTLNMHHHIWMVLLYEMLYPEDMCLFKNFDPITRTRSFPFQYPFFLLCSLFVVLVSFFTFSSATLSFYFLLTCSVYGLFSYSIVKWVHTNKVSMMIADRSMWERISAKRNTGTEKLCCCAKKKLENHQWLPQSKRSVSTSNVILRQEYSKA